MEPSGAPERYVLPELLDATVDGNHRSFMSAVRGLDLGTMRARVSMATMKLDLRWIPK